MRWKQMRGRGASKFQRMTGMKPVVFEQMREVVLAGGGRRGPSQSAVWRIDACRLLMFCRERLTFAHLGASFGVSEAQSRRIVTDLEARLLRDTGALILLRLVLPHFVWKRRW